MTPFPDTPPIAPTFPALVPILAGVRDRPAPPDAAAALTPNAGAACRRIDGRAETDLPAKRRLRTLFAALRSPPTRYRSAAAALVCRLGKGAGFPGTAPRRDLCNAGAPARVARRTTFGPPQITEDPMAAPATGPASHPVVARQAEPPARSEIISGSLLHNADARKGAESRGPAPTLSPAVLRRLIWTEGRHEGAGPEGPAERGPAVRIMAGPGAPVRAGLLPGGTDGADRRSRT